MRLHWFVSNIVQGEAGSAHTQDLQALRAESQASIEQLRAAHQNTIDGIKADHQAALDSQVKALEKKLQSRDLELKATQEDLSKAKSALAASVPELESIKAQLDEARRASEVVATSVSADQIAEVERLHRYGCYMITFLSLF